MDRNAILQGYIDSYNNYSANTSGITVEKVLKFSGETFDIRERSDIRTEVVVFRLLGGQSNYMVDENKPSELDQDFVALVYLEQADHHTAKEARYDRMLALTDDLINWADQVDGASITTDVYDVMITGVNPVREEDGYLTTEVNFQSTIKIRD